MQWEVTSVSEKNAHEFLRNNHATREVVYIKHHDEWVGIYDNNKLISVTGISVNPKHGYVKTGGSFTHKYYRGKGCIKAIYAYILSKYHDRDFVIYSRPVTSHVLQKYHAFKKTQSFKNGTDKCVLKRGSVNGKTKN